MSQLSIELVLTAHPTEITRRTLIHKLVEVNTCLSQLDHNDLADYEAQQDHAPPAPTGGPVVAHR